MDSKVTTTAECCKRYEVGDKHDHSGPEETLEIKWNWFVPRESCKYSIPFRYKLKMDCGKENQISWNIKFIIFEEINNWSIDMIEIYPNDLKTSIWRTCSTFFDAIFLHYSSKDKQKSLIFH